MLGRVGVLVVLLAAATAWGEQSTVTPVVRAWLQPPGLLIVDNLGGEDRWTDRMWLPVGASLALELQRRWFVEAGYTAYPFGDTRSWDVRARAGHAWTARSTRTQDARRWEVQGIVLAGYRYVSQGVGLSECSKLPGPWPGHVVDFQGGVAFTRWVTPRFGLSLRLLAGFGLLYRQGLSQTGANLERCVATGPMTLAVTSEIGLSLGAAFDIADGSRPLASSPPPAPPLAVLGWRVRLQLPWLTRTYPHGGDFAPSLGGGAVGVDLRRRYTLEIGTSHMPLFGHNGNWLADMFVRGGFTPTLSDWRDPSSRGWTLQAVLLGGYRYLVNNIHNDGVDNAWPNHGLVANVGIELMRWFTRRVGFSVRFLAGADLLLRRSLRGGSAGWELAPTGPVEAGLAWDLGLDIGLAF